MTIIFNREDTEKLLAVSSLDIDKDVLKVGIDNMPKGRLYKLQNGDIFSINETTIEYFENNFYEVKLTYSFDEDINAIMPKYKRTGKVFALNEVESLAK